MTQLNVTTPKTPSKTNATTSSDPYKTEFVKVYQDAGVIGVAMLTLLVICTLLAILTFRLAKMYSSLVTARDSLDAARVTVIEKLTEKIVEIRGEVGAARGEVSGVRIEVEQNRDVILAEVRRNREESQQHREYLLVEFGRMCDRVSRQSERRGSSKPPRNRQKPEKAERRGP